MFKNKAKKLNVGEAKVEVKETKNETNEASENLTTTLKNKNLNSQEYLQIKELLEKNLKWSQILYEQNRKINSKLFWWDVAGWIKIAIIAIPIVLAFIYLPPYFQSFFKQYQNILGITKTVPVDTNSVQTFLNNLNLSQTQKEVAKSILGN